MANTPNYYEYSDEVVEGILKDRSLSDDEKLRLITDQYIARLKSGGNSPEAVRQQEKDIRDEIDYNRRKIETDFREYSHSKSENVLNMLLVSVRLKEKAIDIASVEIIKNTSYTAIPHTDQHEFNEAKRLGKSVQEIKELHDQQVKEAQEFYNDIHKSAIAFIGYPILLVVAGMFLLIFNALPSGQISYIVGIPMMVILVVVFCYIFVSQNHKHKH